MFNSATFVINFLHDMILNLHLYDLVTSLHILGFLLYRTMFVLIYPNQKEPSSNGDIASRIDERLILCSAAGLLQKLKNYASRQQSSWLEPWKSNRVYDYSQISKWKANKRARYQFWSHGFCSYILFIFHKCFYAIWNCFSIP